MYSLGCWPINSPELKHASNPMRVIVFFISLHLPAPVARVDINAKTRKLFVLARLAVAVLVLVHVVHEFPDRFPWLELQF
jgi:hypothetical protein